MIDSHDLPLKNFVVRTVVVSDFKSNISLCIYSGKFPKCWLWPLHDPLLPVYLSWSLKNGFSVAMFVIIVLIGDTGG